jgi:hypothetical protein
VDKAAALLRPGLPARAEPDDGPDLAAGAGRTFAAMATRDGPPGPFGPDYPSPVGCAKDGLVPSPFGRMDSEAWRELAGQDDPDGCTKGPDPWRRHGARGGGPESLDSDGARLRTRWTSKGLWQPLGRRVVWWDLEGHDLDLVWMTAA